MCRETMYEEKKITREQLTAPVRKKSIEESMKTDFSQYEQQKEYIAGIQKENYNFQGMLRKQIPPVGVTETAPGSPVQQQAAHEETGKEKRESERKKKAAARGGCEKPTRHSYDLHVHMEERSRIRAVQESHRRMNMDESRKMPSRISYVRNLAGELDRYRIDDRLLSEDFRNANMDEIQDMKDKFDFFRKQLGQTGPEAAGVDPDVRERISRKAEMFDWVAQTAETYRRANGVAEDGSYVDAASMDKAKADYENLKNEGKEVFLRHWDEELEERRADCLRADTVNRADAEKLYAGAVTASDLYQEGSAGELLCQGIIEAVYPDIYHCLSMRAEAMASMQALGGMSGMEEREEWLGAKLAEQREIIEKTDEHLERMGPQRELLESVLGLREGAISEGAARVLESGMLDRCIDRALKQREKDGSLEERLDGLAQLRSAFSEEEGPWGELLKERIRERCDMAAAQTPAQARAEAVKESALPGITERQWERTGGASFHQKVTVEEAIQAADASKGFLYYTEGKDGMAELRATLPETVRMNGRDYPLRRTYNRMTKLALSIFVKQDESGNAVMKGERVVDTMKSASLLQDAMQKYYSGEQKEPLLEMLCANAAELYGEGQETEEMSRDIETLLDCAGVELGREFFSDLLGNFGRVHRGLTDLKTAPEQETEEHRKAREAASNDAEEVMKESALILKMDDDDIDVALPNACSCNAGMIENIRANMLGEQKVIFEHKALRDQLKDHQMTTARNMLMHMDTLSKESSMITEPARQGTLMKGIAAAVDHALSYYEGEKGSELYQKLSQWKAQVEQERAGLAKWIEDAGKEYNKMSEGKPDSLKLYMGQKLREKMAEQEQEQKQKQEQEQEQKQEQEQEQKKEWQFDADRLKPKGLDLDQLLQTPPFSEETLRDTIRGDIFDDDDTGALSMFSSMAKYDYHRAAYMGTTQDGTVFTSETFASETKDYVSAPLTRTKKSVGKYRQTDPKKLQSGFISFYNMDNAVPEKKDQPYIDLKQEEANILQMLDLEADKELEDEGKL